MKKQFRAIVSFWREQYGHYVFITTIAFLAICVMAYIAGRIFPDIPTRIIDWFNESVENSGIVQEDGSFSVLALLGSNVRAMVLSALYGFIPFLYLPALSLGLNAAIIGMLAAMMQERWLLFAAGILPHGIFELPALVLSLAAGLCLCQNINHYIRKNEKGVMKPLMLNLLRVICLLVLPLLTVFTRHVQKRLLVVAAVMECYVTPQVMQLFM